MTRAAASPGHPDNASAIEAVSSGRLACAVSKAGIAIEGDYGIEPPPRGACREMWKEALEDLRGITNSEIVEGIKRVREALAGEFQEEKS